MYQEILIYVRKHIKDRNSAEDITQDTFLQYSKCKDEIKEPRPCLYRVATFKIIDWKRDQKKQALSHTDLNNIAVPIVEDYSPLHSAISLLSKIEQAVIKAVYFDGLSTLNAADKLDINPNTLYSHLDRGREKIRLTLTSS